MTRTMTTVALLMLGVAGLAADDVAVVDPMDLAKPHGATAQPAIKAWADKVKAKYDGKVIRMTGKAAPASAVSADGWTHLTPENAPKHYQPVRLRLDNAKKLAGQRITVEGKASVELVSGGIKFTVEDAKVVKNDGGR